MDVTEVRGLVVTLQKLLNKLGTTPALKEDGILGPKTEAAIDFYLDVPKETPPPAVTPGGKKVKLGIIIGHTKASQGAVMAAPYRISEYVFNTEIAYLAKERAPSNVEVQIFTRDSGGITGAYNRVKAASCDCAIELHFNAFNTKAYGVETLVSNEGADKQFGAIVQAKMLKVFGHAEGSRGDRGLLIDPSRGGQSIRSFVGGPNCLVEPFFGDNPEEAARAMARKKEYADCLWQSALELKNL